MANLRPMVTLTSDFGIADHYVAAMKAAILRHCPEAMLIDVTHQIPPQNVLAGSIVLERAVDAFDAGTVHLAVVDPTVGTERRLLIARIRSQWIVCPDNGLITWTFHRWGGEQEASLNELIWRPAEVSATFHGRDVMAPAAGKLAGGADVTELARPISDPILLAAKPASQLEDAEIIYIDHYGNAMTNVTRQLTQSRPNLCITVANRKIGSIRRTYADVACGDPLALIGSSDFLEIAVRNGSAAILLGLKVGEKVQIQ